MKTKIKSVLKISTALILCLTMAACTQAQILTDLEIAAAAAAAVAAVPGIPPTISTDISLAVTALDCVTGVIQTGGTAAAVSTAVAACGLKTVATAFPAGTPQVVIAVLAALNSAIANVLKDQAAITPATVSRLGASGKKFSLGFGGKSRAEKIHKSLAETKTRLTVATTKK